MFLPFALAIFTSTPVSAPTAAPTAAPTTAVTPEGARAAVVAPPAAHDPLPPAASAGPSAAPHVDTPALVEAPRRYRLLVLNLKGNDVSPEATSTVQGLVTAALAEYPAFDVISGEDLKNLAALESERQETGCTADAGCLAEIADALGAQLVVFGNVGRLGESIVVNLNLFDAAQAAGLGRAIVQAAELQRLPIRIKPKVRDLVTKFHEMHGLPLPALVEEKDEVAVAETFDPGPWPLATAIAGGSLIVLGAVAAGIGGSQLLTYNDAKAKVATFEQAFAADQEASHLVDAKPEQARLVGARDAWNGYGSVLFAGGLVAAGVGVLSGAGGMLWFLSVPPAHGDPASRASVPTPQTSTAPGATP